MTIETIKKYYKWLSVVTLILSIVGPTILIGGTIGERIWVGVLMNLQFHLTFQFLSRVPFGMYQHVESDSPWTKLTRKFLIFFSWMTMFFSIIGFAVLLMVALDDYRNLLVTMMFPAIFLGGYSSKVKLDSRATKQ